MNTQTIEKKMKAYYDIDTSEQVVKEFEELGVEFAQMELTKEQYEAIVEMQVAWAALSVGIRTKVFLEKELGLVHRICVDYRKSLLKELDDNFKASQFKVESLGALDILVNKLNHEKNFISET